ncbi:MAG: hypothetical protein AAGD25_27285 [Cyanobacteria bacterium P01_F01_bin.150]
MMRWKGRSPLGNGKGDFLWKAKPTLFEIEGHGRGAIASEFWRGDRCKLVTKAERRH